MTHVVASLGLILVGCGCFFVVGSTPRNTPIWFDGPFMLAAIVLWLVGIAGLLNAAF